MTRLTNVSVILTVVILLTSTIVPSIDLLPSVEAIKGKGVTLTKTGSSSNICGLDLCSEIPGGKEAYFKQSKTSTDTSAETTAEKLNLLFVQTAEKGKIEKTDGGKYILTLYNVNEKTIYFSDRPNRVTGQWDTSLYVSLWDKGENSFKDNPPNAAIQVEFGDGQSDVTIIELLNPQYDETTDTLTYEIKYLVDDNGDLNYFNKYTDDEFPTNFKHVVLFIDDWNAFWNVVFGSVAGTVVGVGCSAIAIGVGAAVIAGTAATTTAAVVAADIGAVAACTAAGVAAGTAVGAAKIIG